jgi:hypothetical protein
MLPALSKEQLAELNSPAEARIYEALRSQLPSDCTVLFELPWVGTGASGTHFDGECDFIIMRPGWCLLVVEAKGGGVRFDANSGLWTSVDRHRNEHEIKDPFRQALTQKHQIVRLLNSDPDWKKSLVGKISAGHAVIFPDINGDLVEGPWAPREIVAGRAEMQSLRQWVDGLNSFWSAGENVASPLSPALIKAAIPVLAGKAHAMPLVAAELEREERRRVELTAQQGRVLRAISKRARAKICGGAGTGKTVLAVQRASELAAQGLSTLLICYNQLLSQQMDVSSRGTPGLQVMTFHKLCDWYAKVASIESGSDVMALARSICASQGRRNHFEDILPAALLLGTMVCNQRFEAIVVDEGQDFHASFWGGVNALLRDASQSRLYVFLDPNQAIYTTAAEIPVEDEPFLLTFNCRNTQAIHRFAYRYYRGDSVDPPPGLQGAPVEAIASESLDGQIEAIRTRVAQLIIEEGVAPKSIAVLVCGQPMESYKPLAKTQLPNGLQWSLEGPVGCSGVRIDTVRRFKGLEADYVFLWGLESMKFSDRDEVIYVGSTRAKSRLVLVGTTAATANELTTAR